MVPALLLDRDGVIIENRSTYVRSWADVEIFPQALQALSFVKNSPYKIIIVTNQSAVGRGLVDLEEVNRINDRLIREINRAGGRIDGVFVCPHAPQDNCTCRKPQPGLLLEAARTMSLDLPRSIMIGDALSDLQAGKAAGISRLVLVKTGRGIEQASLLKASSLMQFCIYGDLFDALQALFMT
jgi:D-glycero-D-manno-heptose 1,7-bisphosphate phosphatase